MSKKIIVRATRMDVHPSDDPQPLELEFADGTSIPKIIQKILDLKFLPSISGGEATWVVTSGILLGVFAEQWASPKLKLDIDEAALDYQGGVLRIFFSYLSQEDPDLVFSIINRIRARGG